MTMQLFHFFMSIIIFLSSMVVNPPEGGAWIAMPATDMLLIFGGIIWNVVVSFKECVREIEVDVDLQELGW